MLIRSRLESKSQQRKKLSINSSPSNSSKSNLKITTNIQQKHRSSIFRPSGIQIQQQIDGSNKQENNQLPSIQKQNLSIKKAFYHNKSEEKCQEPRILRPSLKHIRNQNSSCNFPIVEGKIQKDEHPRPSLGCRKNPPNNRLILSHLMSTSSNKGENFKNIVEEPLIQLIEPKKDIPVRRAANKKSNTVYIERIETQLLEQIASVTSQSITQQSLFESIPINCPKPKNLSYEFMNIQITILPVTKPQLQKHDVQVQAIQQQREYFEYLKYKRRKQQFETELENLFMEITLVKNDRAIYETRIEKLKSCQSQQPKNQRQQRVFKIKDQIAKQQKKIENIIVENFVTLQKYHSQLGKLDQILLCDSERFLQTFNQNFRMKTDDSKLNILGNVDMNFDKMENSIRNFLKQSTRKIELLIQRNKPSKQDLLEMISVFDEYKKTIYEQKSLLKNCFSHIKKIPQLCYGLCGNELPGIESRNQFRNDNNEFSMPKCLDCFNSEWKLHLIIEKNISMESILKVTQQLLK